MTKTFTTWVLGKDELKHSYLFFLPPNTINYPGMYVVTCEIVGLTLLEKNTWLNDLRGIPIKYL